MLPYALTSIALIQIHLYNRLSNIGDFITIGNIATWRSAVKYKVHRMEIDLEKDQAKLEQFLNNLRGEVVSIIPNIAKTTLFQIYGVTRKINFVLIIEKM